MSRAIVAEFHKTAGGRLRLFSVTSVTFEEGCHHSLRCYDVEYSRRHGYLFNQSGFGGGTDVTVSGIYAVSGDGLTIIEEPSTLVDTKDKPPWRGKKTRAIRARNRTRRLRQMPKEFACKPGQDLIDWLQWNGAEQEAVWCTECRDNVRGDELCEHVWWCDKVGWYSTEANGCKCKTWQESRDCEEGR